MLGIKVASIRALAVIAALGIAFSAPGAFAQSGSKPVVTEVVFRWQLEPFMGNGMWWMIRLNLIGYDPDGGNINRRILVLDREGGFRGSITTLDYAPDTSVALGEPGVGWRQEDQEMLDLMVGGQVIMSLFDAQGNESDPVVVPISAPPGTNSSIIEDVSFDEQGGKIVVSGVALNPTMRVMVNGKRVRPAAVSAGENGSIVIDVAKGRLASAKSFHIRLGAGKQRTNAAFLRR